MSTWSAFTVGGYDPLMTNQEQQDARQDAKAQLRNQVQYDIWRTNVLPGLQLQQANKDYWLEQNLAANRTRDAVSNQRAALVNAGFNPLLALGSGIGSAPGSGQQPLVASNSAGVVQTRGSSVNGISGSPFDIASAHQALENQEKQGKLLDAQINETAARVRHLNATTAQTEKETEYIGSSNMTKLLQSVYDAKFRDVDDGSVSPFAKTGSLGDMLYQFKTYLGDLFDRYSSQVRKVESEKKNDAKKSSMSWFERIGNFNVPF